MKKERPEGEADPLDAVHYFFFLVAAIGHLVSLRSEQEEPLQKHRTRPFRTDDRLHKE